MTTATTLKIRQSDLRTLCEQCPASAYAKAVEGKRGPSGPGADRGSAIHDFFAAYVEHLYRTGRQTDWDAVAELLTAYIYQKPAYQGLTMDQYQDINRQAATIAQVFVLNAATYYGTEEPFETTLVLDDGSECLITGRVDYLAIEDGIADLIDWKSNHVILPDSRVKEDFQGRCYSMLIMDTLPHVAAVRFRLGLSRYGLYLPQKGEAFFTREDTDEFRQYLSYLLPAFFRGELKRERVPGTWCQYCPLRRTGECTLYRSYYGTTPPPPLKEPQALKLARQIIALEQAREIRMDLLKSYVNEHGPMAVGSGDAAETFAFHMSESEGLEASALLAILEEHRSLVGDQPLDELLNVNKRSKAYKNLRYHSELRSAFDDATTLSVSTRFKHKRVGDGDE